MSVCDEGWAAGWCPAFHWAKDTPDPYCAMHPAQVFRINQDPPDSCPFAPILRALPTATDEQLTLIREVLEKITDTSEDCHPCPTCGGSGSVDHPTSHGFSTFCPTCHGSGKGER